MITPNFSKTTTTDFHFCQSRDGRQVRPLLFLRPTKYLRYEPKSWVRKLFLVADKAKKVAQFCQNGNVDGIFLAVAGKNIFTKLDQLTRVGGIPKPAF